MAGTAYALAALQDLDVEQLAPGPLHQALLFAQQHRGSLSAAQHETLLSAAKARIRRDSSLAGEPLAALIPPAQREELLAALRPPSTNLDASIMGAGALAGAMEDLGPACTASQAAFEALLAQRGPVDEAAAARVFTTMARRHGGRADAAGSEASPAALAATLASPFPQPGDQGSSWDLGVVMAALRPQLHAMSVERLAEALDHEGFALPDARAFLLLMACWRQATGDKPFPLPALIQRPWKNLAGQGCCSGVVGVVCHGCSDDRG
jgi:hypothetical protein